MANQPSWRGDEIITKLHRASRLGINHAMAICVRVAKDEHPFTNRTTTAEKSIRVAQPARTEGVVTYGIWGSTLNNYFKYLEFGTKFTKTRTSIGQRMRILRTGVFKRKNNAGAPPWNGGSWAPTLRPTATKIYPNVGAMIKQAWVSL